MEVSFSPIFMWQRVVDIKHKSQSPILMNNVELLIPWSWSS